MVNYACAFSQSEFGKYFEWIIKSLEIKHEIEQGSTFMLTCDLS